MRVTTVAHQGTGTARSANTTRCRRTAETLGSGAASLRDAGDTRTPMEVCTLIALLEEAMAQGKVVDVPGLL